MRCREPIYYHNNLQRDRIFSPCSGQSQPTGNNSWLPRLCRHSSSAITASVQRPLLRDHKTSFMPSLPAPQQPIKFFFVSATALLVAIMAGISLIYITTPRDHFTLDISLLGWIGWATLATSTLCIAFQHKREFCLIFLSFFLFGFFSKAYLEPASDQIDHLYRTYERCRDIDTGERLNRGLWHYSMNSLLLCDRGKEVIPAEKKLLHIDTLHGLFISFSSTILYFLSRNAGLPKKWCFFSIMTATFFMGTDKFSYFRYYSYGPSFSSICIYWLWITQFFFSRKRRALYIGALTSIPLAIIMAVNHIQESAFLLFILFIWITIILTEKIYKTEKKRRNLSLWLTSLFLFFFIFPQMQWTQEIFQLLPIQNLWENNQNLVYYWKGIHIMGKIWIPFYRVPETIGVIGLAPLILCPIIWLNNKTIISQFLKIRVIALGIVPFLVFCTPLLHHIWVSFVKIPVYYRIAYSSLFWITVAYFLYIIETHIVHHLNRKSDRVSQ